MIDVIANRYAEALFQIGEEENKTDNLYNELKEVSSLITTNNDLNNVMKSPLVSKNEKIQLIDTLFAGKIDNVTEIKYRTPIIIKAITSYPQMKFVLHPICPIWFEIIIILLNPLLHFMDQAKVFKHPFGLFFSRKRIPYT